MFTLEQTLVDNLLEIVAAFGQFPYPPIFNDRALIGT